jgi:Transglutaminase-like superfamily
VLTRHDLDDPSIDGARALLTRATAVLVISTSYASPPLLVEHSDRTCLSPCTCTYTFPMLRRQERDTLRDTRPYHFLQLAWLTLQALVDLIHTDIVWCRGFRALHTLVRETHVSASHQASDYVNAVTAAVDTACAIYTKHTHCLQRSVVVTRLLRRGGVAAQLMIGCHVPVDKGHAWVEVAGQVVCEQRPDLKYYAVIDRW